jgi:hypothetical protein
MNFESTSLDNPERLSDLVFKFPSINWFIYPLITFFIYVRICLLNHLPVNYLISSQDLWLQLAFRP